MPGLNFSDAQTLFLADALLMLVVIMSALAIGEVIQYLQELKVNRSFHNYMNRKGK